MVKHISAIDNAPGASTPLPSCLPHRVSPIRFSLPAEEGVLGLEEDVLGFQSTDFPPGSLSSECAGCVVDSRNVFDHISEGGAWGRFRWSGLVGCICGRKLAQRAVALSRGGINHRCIVGGDIRKRLWWNGWILNVGVRSM